MPLPPPPVPLSEAAPPPVSVAILTVPQAGGQPEVLWTDEATAGAKVPRIPSMTPNAPAAGASVDQVLAAIRQEAPKNATLESMLFDQLRAAMPQGIEGYIFERVTIPNLANLPAGGWRVRYDFHMPARGVGPAPFMASIIGEGGQVLRTFTGSVTIDREAGGVQVTRVIHRGEPLGPGDVRVLGTRLSQLPRGALDRIDALAGTEARQELRPGQWLTDQMVRSPEIVRQGQPVTMVLTRGPIRINAPGIARQGGAAGEVIKVENTQSKREIHARIISKDEVQVIFQ